MDNTAHLFTQKYSASDESLKKLQVLFRLLAIGLGLLHVYAAIKSQSMNADGITYLDIGDAYFRADWANAINPVWSPFYSWVLGFANIAIRPSTQWEFPLVHLVNFIIYLIALGSFEFMWRRVRIRDEAVDQSFALPEFWWWTLGYLLFIWISLSFIEIWAVTPDMLMAVFVFLATGLIAKIRAGDANFRTFICFGVVLGLGYLSKTFMLAIALTFLALSIFVVRRKTKILPFVLGATGTFLLVSLPFILLISEKKGEFTIGESGTVTYLRYVNGMPFPHWQGDPGSGIVPAHPSRIVHQSPPIYEFGEPIGGTYPISTDPSFWYEGIEPRFELRGLFARLFASGFVYAELFLQRQGILLACVLGLYVMGQRHKLPLQEAVRRWTLVIPAVVAFALYATVLVEDRYVGVFVVLFWTDILGNVRLPSTENNSKWLGSLCAIAALGLMTNILLFNLEGFRRFSPSVAAGGVEPSVLPARPLAVAEALRDLGVMPGDRVGVIGYGYDSFWARLARVKIVAELLEKDAIDLWYADEEQWRSVLRDFAGANVRAVVAEYVPDDVHLNDWHRVSTSNYYIYLFEE